MNKKIIVVFLALCIGINFSIMSTGTSQEQNQVKTSEYIYSDDYYVQWEMNFGSDDHYGARYEGPQPIGDCDNDGENEMLVVGRDNKIRVFEWNEEKQTYLEMHTLLPPLYPYVVLDAGGFAIGDLTGDGKNEIAASWGASVHKWIGGKYRVIGFNSYVFENGGGIADCLIGDYDDDGENELILSGGPLHQGSDVENLVIFKWTSLGLVKEAEWKNPSGGYSYIYMAGIGDVDEDGKNEIVCGSGFRVYVLDWNPDTNTFDETVIKTVGEDYYPFACVCKDSDMDGKNEIHLGYWAPMVTIMEWDGDSYELKYEKEWPGEGALIEGLDVGDVDDDGNAEVCAGTHLVHILQWDGSTYVEEAVLPTFGELAVVSIGDCDNDGKNEIQAGSVMIDHGEDYMAWVYKYGIGSDRGGMILESGRLTVETKTSVLKLPLKNASVAAWNLDTGTWYDIQPSYGDTSIYIHYDLPEGEYLLRALMEGYKIEETTVTINGGQETTHTFYLKKTLSKGVPVYHPSNPVFYRILERLLQMPFFKNVQLLFNLIGG